MKISIITASHRKNSQSKKISNLLSKNLTKIASHLDLFLIDLATSSLPLWTPEKKQGKGVWGKTWKIISSNLKQSDGFIFVVPEYGGMATPAAKNFFLLCGEGEFSHKPGLIVSVSSGNGGAYPIAEVIMGINAFAQGLRSVNKDAKISVIWANTWYDPVKEADSAKVHIAEGADILAQHTDSPAMLQIAEKEGALGFGQSTDMSAFAPKAQLFASINNWGPYYIKKIEALRNGKWSTGEGPDHWAGNVWGGLKSDMLLISKFQNMPDDVAKKAQEALDGLKNGSINIFAVKSIG